MRTAILFFIVALNATFCSAALITVQDGNSKANGVIPLTTTIEDARIPGTVPDNNLGQGLTLIPGRTINFPDRSLLRFNLSSLAGGPYGTVTGNGTLTLTRTAEVSAAGAGEVLYLHALVDANAAWIEGSQSNALALNGEPTWNNRSHPSTAWTGGTGLGSPLGYTSGGGTAGYGAAFASYTLPGILAPGSTVTLTIPQAMIQDWINVSGGNPNAGIILRLSTESAGETNRTAFHSSEAATAGDRPLLTFNAVPEPAGFVTLLLGGTCLLPAIRRRRNRIGSNA